MEGATPGLRGEHAGGQLAAVGQRLQDAGAPGSPMRAPTRARSVSPCMAIEGSSATLRRETKLAASRSARPQLTLTIAAVMLRAQSEAAKTAALPTSSSVAARPSSVCPSIMSTISSRPSKPSGSVSGTPPLASVTTRIPCAPELDGELAPHRLDRVEGDLRPSQVVVARGAAAVARAAEGEDHARAPRDHVPRRRPRGQERRPRGGLHRRHEVVDRHLGERDPVRVAGGRSG